MRSIKIRTSLKTAVIRQMETFFELMSEDGLVNLGQIRDELYSQSEKGSANASFNRFIKQINEELAVQGSKARLAITADKKAGDKRECWFEAEPVQFPIPHTPQLDAIPDDQLEQSQLGQPVLDVDIVLITFNQYELEQTLRCFCPEAPAVQMEGHNRVYYQLGKHGGQNLVLMHSRQATIEAMRSAEIAIEFFHPNAVIALGIAFGINSEKQQIGEVLISESITTYELARINKDGCITPRGPRPPASKYLRDWFHQLDAYLIKEKSAEYAKRHFGSMFSGDKLIDNKDYRDQLLSIDPEAIGGEMEGTGIYYACEASKTDWIIVKAICDFADGNKGKNKDANQKIAAENAARLVKAALEFGNFYPAKKISAPEKLRTKHPLKNFHDYTANCTNLHEIDERALVKDARALPTTLKKEQAALLEQEHTNGIPVVARLLDWAQEPQAKSVFAILGEYGMGKTISSQLFDKQLRSLLTQNKLLPVPLYFDLRHVTSKTLADGFQFSDIINDCIRFGWLKSDSSEEFSFSDIERWANQSGVVLIFDGLDEVLVKLSESDGRIFTDQLYKYQAQLKANSKQPVKMLLTCRSQYFKTLDRQKDHFTGQERGGVSADDIEAMVMLPLTEEQITNYLRHALPGIDPATIIDMVKSVHDLHDLSKRPFTLKLVGEFFPALEEDRKAGKAISGVSLYRRVVERWLNRDDGKHQIKSDHKLQLASHLAALLWKQKQSALPASEIEDWFQSWLMDNPTIENRYKAVKSELLEEDLRTATFLCRQDSEEGSRFRFSHTSLQEYFLANYLLQAISANKPEHWALAKPSRETLVFLAQLLAEPENKSLLYKLSEWRKIYRQSTSENLLHYALVAYELGFSLPLLNGIQLTGANLAELGIQATSNNLLSLEGANFSGANLRRARFSFVNLDGANFSEAILDNAEFDKCSLNHTQWSQAAMAATCFFRCSLETANFATAKVYRSRLLDCGTLPEKIENDYRWLINQNFESVKNYYSMSGHTDAVTSCAFSADGQHIVSGSQDNTLRIWDFSSGDCIQVLTGHKRSITSCAFSPDGNSIISASGDKSLRLWDFRTGDCLKVFNEEHWITCCAFTPDGKNIISSTYKELSFWELENGQCTRAFKGHTDLIRDFDISKDGNQLISCSEDCSLKLWDIATGSCLKTFIESKSFVASCAFSNDGKYVVAGCEDQYLRIWNVEYGNCTHEVLSKYIRCCRFSVNDQNIIAGSSDKKFAILDLNNLIPVEELEGHFDSVICCDQSPNGKYLISGSLDNNLRLWNFYNGECLRILNGSKNNLMTCDFNYAGNYIISATYEDNIITLRDVTNGKIYRKINGQKAGIRACASSPNGLFIASGSFDCTIQLWNTNNGQCFNVLEGHQHTVINCVFSTDSRYLLSSSADKTLRLWDAQSGACLKILNNYDDHLEFCAFNQDDSYLITYSSHGHLVLWDIKNGILLEKTNERYYRVTSCVFSSNTEIIFCSIGKINRWNILNGQISSISIEATNVICSDFSYNGELLILNSEDNGTLLIDTNNGEIINTFEDCDSQIKRCIFSKDNLSILCSTNTAINIWSINDRKPRLKILVSENSNYLCVDASQQTILAKSEYAWRYFNGYFINEKGELDSFPVI